MNTSNNEKYKQIGIKIAYYQTQLGYTQQQLADKVGISKSYLSKIESQNTIKSFSLDVLFTLANALNVKTTDLIEE